MFIKSLDPYLMVFVFLGFTGSLLFIAGTTGTTIGNTNAEADKNDKINKIVYGHLEEGTCTFDQTISAYPIGWCREQAVNYGGGSFIKDINANLNSVISVTAPLDGDCRIRLINPDVGFLIYCTVDPSSPLNYVIMNP